MSNSLNKEKLDSILLGDHAGETAAAKIYDGQLAILKNTPVGPKRTGVTRKLQLLPVNIINSGLAPAGG